jgi:hypothetical protein
MAEFRPEQVYWEEDSLVETIEVARTRIEGLIPIYPNPLKRRVLIGDWCLGGFGFGWPFVAAVELHGDERETRQIRMRAYAWWPTFCNDHEVEPGGGSPAVVFVGRSYPIHHTSI